MITETRQSRTRLLHYYEHRSRRRHHTLDNATLDKFNFICVPLHLNEARIASTSSQSNLTITPSNEFFIPKSTGFSSPTRRVRFQFDENQDDDNNNNQHTYSSDDVRLPKKHSIHRVEVQIPIQRNINSCFNVDCSSAPAKTRSITSKKIDINYNNKNTMHLQDVSSLIDSPTLSTIDSDKTHAQWYKDMYGQLHKSPETKKDEHQNPYKPTYTFPEELDGNLERLEDYIRKAASQDIEDDDDDCRNVSSLPIRTLTTNVKDRQIIPKQTHLDEQLSSPIASSPTERTKSNNDTSPSSITIHSRSSPNYIRTSSSPTTDDKQKLIYKRILRGGDIPSTGLQKVSINNRVSSSSTQRPLILTNHSQTSTQLFAYYSVHWEQNQSNNLIDNDALFEINSCLYFQNHDHDNDDDDDDDELEQVREDGCGYVITYPPHIHPTDKLQIYNFDRTKDFLLTSNNIYSNSKKDYNYFVKKSEKKAEPLD